VEVSETDVVSVTPLVEEGVLELESCFVDELEVEGLVDSEVVELEIVLVPELVKVGDDAVEELPSVCVGSVGLE